MTCIVALRSGKSVIVGGDSAGCLPDEVNIMAAPKVFKNKQFVIGYTGSFRVGQLLQYSFKPPRLTSRTVLRHYMVNKFVRALQKCLKDHEAVKLTSTQMASSEFVVAISNSIYIVDSDYAVSEWSSDYAVSGLGAPYAMGSLYTSANEKDPKVRIIKALESAANFSPWVRQPFTLLTT